jgi:hypothetical protein
MKRLGEILLDRGAIGVTELHTGLEACHYSGGRLGTQLLKFGFVDEHALLEALSEQLSVPPVSSAILKRAPDGLRRMLPLDVCRRLQVLVFERIEGCLGIAMTNPRSPSIIEEVVSYLGLDIKPHVATEVGILSALADVREKVARPEVPNSSTVPVGQPDEWQRLWTPSALQGGDLLRTLHSRNDDHPAMAATFPGLAPIPDAGTVTSTLLDGEAFSAQLKLAEHRDDVGDLLLRRAAAILTRCYVLAVHSGKMAGWLARGQGMVVDDIQALTIPVDEPSILSRISEDESFCGQFPAGEVNDLLIQLFGEPAPVEVAVFPVFVKKRVVAFLLGDIPGSHVPEDARNQLLVAVKKAGVAFEILIMKKKILAS